MTAEEKDPTYKDWPFKKRLRFQIIKYWKYTKKWFPFALIIGAISGTMMAVFTSLIINLEIGLTIIPVYIKYPIIGGITSILLFFGYKEVHGAGISHVLSHKNTATPLKARGLVTKFFASVLTLGVGAPAGREGPAVTLGSTASYVIGDKIGMSKEDEMHAITIGAAACTAAVFGAPLGGTVFASEVPYKRDLDETVFLPALVASAISFLVYDSLLNLIQKIPFLPGSYSKPFEGFTLGAFELTFVSALHFLLLGIMAGFLGIGFSLLFKFSAKSLEKKLKPYLLPLIGMAITGLIVFFADTYFFSDMEGIGLAGTGFRSIEKLLGPETIGIGVVIFLLLGKIVVTSTCVGFGNSAGVMGPTLVTGAALGYLYSLLFPAANALALMIVGMSAMHTSTTKTPIASMILVLEIVGFPNLVIPIILSNAMAFIISMDFSLYRGQIQSKEVILRRTIQYTDVLETLTVRESMQDSFVTVNQTDELEEIFPLLYLHKLSSLAVVDDNDNLVGIISAIDFQRGFSKGYTLVKNVMTKEVVTAFPDESLSLIFDRLTTHSIECLPVVEREQPQRLLGIVSFRDIESRYESELTKIHSKRKLTIEEIEDDF